MKKYLLILTLLVIILVYFFIFKEQQSTNLVNVTKDKEIKIEKAKNEKNIENKTENKKVDLIDNFVNTKVKLPKNYEIKDNYEKPVNNEKKVLNEKNNTKIDVNVDINKETKEFEKLKFKFEKNF